MEDLLSGQRLDDKYLLEKLLGQGGMGAVYQLLNLLVAPLTGIMTAQLYLKTRQAGGEVLRDAVDQFEALEIPRSRWQARMRSRSVPPVS